MTAGFALVIVRSLGATGIRPGLGGCRCRPTGRGGNGGGRGVELGVIRLVGVVTETVCVVLVVLVVVPFKRDADGLP
jgi:hypothetical protein